MRQKQQAVKRIHKAKNRIYNPQSLQNAYIEVMEKGMPVLKASRIFGVPRQTLRDRVKNVVSIDCVTTGRTPVFTLEEEGYIVNHIKSMANLGYGYTRQEVVDIGTRFAENLGKRKHTDPLTLRWFSGFVSRWPELRVLKPRSLAHLRAKAASPGNIQRYFTELDGIIKKYDLTDKPHLIFNVDEKGISQCHSPPHVVAGREVHPPAVTSGKSSSTTIIGCGSAAGFALPPYFVFQGARMRQDLLNGTSPGSNGCVSETGWSNSSVFRQYLEEHFLRFIPREDRYVLLLLDGHSTHISVGLIEWAKAHKIILFILPAHTSHILQPLDVGCFGPLQKIYNFECHKEMRLTASTIIRYNIGSLASKAYTKTLSPENLQNAFRKTGIYPFDSSAIDGTILEPSRVFSNDLDVKNSGDNACGPAEDEHTVVHRMADFLAKKEATLISTKSEKQLKKTERKCLSKLTSGRCITEDEVEQAILNYKKDTSSKNTKNAANKKQDKGPILKEKEEATRVSTLNDSQTAGPSGAAVTHKPWLDDWNSEELDIEIREEEKCCVCKNFTPDAVRQSSVLQFFKWGKCNACGHWVHLRYCSKTIAVRRRAEFKCIHCS